MHQTENVRIISFSIANDYGLDDRDSIPDRGRDFYFRHIYVQTGSSAQPVSYPVGTGGSFAECEAIGA